jgi:hypothetical protein
MCQIRLIEVSDPAQQSPEISLPQKLSFEHCSNESLTKLSVIPNQNHTMNIITNSLISQSQNFIPIMVYVLIWMFYPEIDHSDHPLCPFLDDSSSPR